MKALRSSLLGMCALLVALPMPACAFLAGSCHAMARASLKSEPAASHSCCAHRAAKVSTKPSSGQPDRGLAQHKPAVPCAGDCCRVNTVPPVVQKVIADPPFETAVVFHFADETGLSPWRVVAADVAYPPPLTLQSLHCLCRC